MDIVTQEKKNSKRYLPHKVSTKEGAVKLYRQTKDIDFVLRRYHIVHKTIRPKTPWHNGKVERSHRNDQERFYNYLKFYSYEDLQLQMKHYLRRSNRIPMSVLGWQSPIQKRQELEAARFC